MSSHQKKAVAQQTSSAAKEIPPAASYVGTVEVQQVALDASEVPIRRDALFVRSSHASVACLDNVSFRDEELDEDSRDLLIEAFGDFFLLEGEDPTSLRTGLLLKACSREDAVAGTVLIREGELGSKLYVVESGDIEVSIEDHVVRHVRRGNIIGELALLYDAPRSATCRCLTNCSFFVLTRESFRKILMFASSASQIQRSQWISQAADLLSLGSVDITRLTGALETETFLKGEEIYTEGEVTDRVYVIEKGLVRCEFSDPEVKPALETEAQSDYFTGIIRPSGGRRTSISMLSTDDIRRQLEKIRSSEKVIPELFAHQPDVSDLIQADIAFEGCLLGIPMLLVAGFSDTDSGKAAWVWNELREGFVAPYSIVAVSDKVECSFFTLDIFKAFFGATMSVSKSYSVETPHSPMRTIPEVFEVGSTMNSSANALTGLSSNGETLSNVISGRRQQNRGGSRLDLLERKIEDHKYDDDMFFEVGLLGKGSYGTVTFAKCSQDSNFYALKRISKVETLESDQLEHLLSECKILKELKHPYIVKFYGVYLTLSEIVLVLEPICAGDLWGVIYEEKTHARRGVPIELVKFYTATIVLALLHIHSRGVAFRDLKPENLMMDMTGNVHVIDFGFAKKIPYVTTTTNGSSKITMKSYTLCGTPEYLAPEFIFNLGVNKAVDFWALGVIVHEMIMLTTPFRPRRRDDMTSLFVNIASVKKVGLNLSSNLDFRSGGSSARLFISQLLRAEPSERIGMRGKQSKIFEHSFFSGLDISALKRKELKPSFVPNLPPDHMTVTPESAPPFSRPPAKPFFGDNIIWEPFTKL